MTTEVLGYLQYKLLEHGRTQNLTSVRLPHRKSSKNRQGIGIVAKRHLPPDCTPRRQIMTGIHFPFALHQSMEPYREIVLSPYNYPHCISRIMQHWRNNRVKDVCTNRGDANIISYTWQMTFTPLWEIVAYEFKICCHKAAKPLTSIPRKCPIEICCNWPLWIILEDGTRQPVYTDHDGVLQ